MPVQMHPVKSEAISAIGHDPQTSEIHVTFKSGGTHKFGPYAASEFERFRSAPSIGQHYHAHIRAKALK